jgi:predicted esterase
LLQHENRSVWIAQREGRTKDGNDETNPGVLKMLGMGSDEKNLMDYFKKVKLFRFLFPMSTILLMR